MEKVDRDDARHASWKASLFTSCLYENSRNWSVLCSGDDHTDCIYICMLVLLGFPVKKNGSSGSQDAVRQFVRPLGLEGA